MLPEKKLVSLSKFLSLVLRHQPEHIGISLDEHGWTDVHILLQKMKDHGTFLSPEELDFIVANNNKKRFAFSDDKSLIRASQGHSVDIDLGYTEQQPPAYYIMVRLLVLSTRYLQAVSTSAAGIMCT